ncbi:hypothetical protein HK102_001090, partial [Quaeritorhiza haematococci]
MPSDSDSELGEYLKKLSKKRGPTTSTKPHTASKSPKTPTRNSKAATTWGADLEDDDDDNSDDIGESTSRRSPVHSAAAYLKNRSASSSPVRNGTPTASYLKQKTDLTNIGNGGTPIASPSANWRKKSSDETGNYGSPLSRFSARPSPTKLGKGSDLDTDSDLDLEDEDVASLGAGASPTRRRSSHINQEIDSPSRVSPSRGSKYLKGPGAPGGGVGGGGDVGGGMSLGGAGTGGGVDARVSTAAPSSPANATRRPFQSISPRKNRERTPEITDSEEVSSG